jgi:hypothetical protein
MVLQFSPCLVSPTQTYVISGIKDGLVSSLKALDLKHDDPSPNPDVREACINGRDVIAAWFVPTLGYGSWDTSAARTQAMGKTNILQAPETFAINLSKNGLDRMVNVAWRDIPKLSDATGQPNANGPIHLLDERTDLYNAVYRIPTMKEALLTVHGFYDGPTADTDFWAYVEDVMYLSNGHIECDTNVDVDLEPTFDYLLGTILQLFQSPAGMVAQMVGTGPGCRAVATFPVDVMIPNLPNAKIHMTYTRLNLDATGITGAGTAQFAPRNPAASIVGPSYIKANAGWPASGKYQITTTDMRGPVTVIWSSPDATFSVNGNATTTATWDYPNAAAGTIINRIVTANVTDQDNNTVTAWMVTKLEYVEDVNIPDICDNPLKWNLPQCNPQP